MTMRRSIFRSLSDFSRSQEPPQSLASSQSFSQSPQALPQSASPRRRTRVVISGALIENEPHSPVPSS